MTRWLVLLVALINGLAWWWLTAQRGTHPTPPPQAAAVSASTAAIPKLLLLREVAPEPSVPSGVYAAPESGATADLSHLREPIDVEGPPVPAAPAEPEEMAPAAADVEHPEGATGAAPPPECLLLGGNVDRAQLIAWQAQLRLAGLAVADTIATTHQEVVSGYRVYLPAGRDPGSQVEALRRAGIEALIVAEANTAQRLSAGVFRVHTNALRRQRELANLGYAAQIVATRRPSISFWVEVRGPNGLSDRASRLLNRESRDAQAAVWQPCTATLRRAAPEVTVNPAGQE
jgi:hypothetical protein